MSPFSDHFQYIQHIVLPNLAEFLQAYKRDPKNIRSNSRLFVNAAISMNHIPDYMFWEWEEEFKEIGVGNERKLMKKLKKLEAFSFMEQISDVANAAKHCVRRDQGKRNNKKLAAKDLATNKMSMEIELFSDKNKDYVKSIDVSSKIYSESYYEENYEIIETAWRFWVKYHPNQFKDKILEKIDGDGDSVIEGS